MDRRTLLTSTGALAAAVVLRPTARALAQAAGAGTITFGQSTSIVTLDPADALDVVFAEEPVLGARAGRNETMKSR